MLQPIDPKNREDVETIARLHNDLLDWGPISNLGRLFLKRFVYSQLISDDLIKAVLFKVDGKAAGFIAYTAYSNTFLSRAIKRHRVKVLFLLTISILQDPRILFRLHKAFRLAYSLRGEKDSGENRSAEILAIGVLPKYREPQFIRKTGLRISRELVAHAVTFFRSEGLRQMHLFVDEFNKPTIFFYRFLGGHSKPLRRAGETMIKISFDLDKMEI
jgi:ribosomal protein S18 acetylase RimI-like enzyme